MSGVRERPAFMSGRDATMAPAALVAERELAVAIDPLAAPRPGIDALVLVRLFDEPIGILQLGLPASGLNERQLADAIWAELGPVLSPRLEQCGLELDQGLPVDGLRPPRTPPSILSRDRVLAEGPAITAAVCTRDRPEGLAKLLESLLAQSYPRLRILVVDNAPSDERTRQLVAGMADEHEIDYVCEPRPGLSWARNRAVQEARTDVVAWVDDDEVCDRWWATEIARGFVAVPEAGAVAGLVFPAELDTPSQVWFERFSGVARGRGFERTIFSPETLSRPSMLYPRPPFGIGGNMAFRRTALERIGGFDCALGPGTLAMDGDDTAAISLLLLAGGTVVYQPSAIVHHRHRRDYAELRGLLLAYGRGLGAFYTSMLLHRPSCALQLARLVPRAIRDQFLGTDDRVDTLGTDFPRELLRRNRIGILQGPVAYLRALVVARRLRLLEG
jgi:glycosyltransferase involved in cell wall biosynthesis